MTNHVADEIRRLEDEVAELEDECSRLRSSINNCKNTLRNLHADVDKYNLNRGIVGPATEFLDQRGVYSVAEEACEYAENTVRRSKG